MAIMPRNDSADHMTNVGGIWHGRVAAAEVLTAKAVRAELSSQLGELFQPAVAREQRTE